MVEKFWRISRLDLWPLMFPLCNHFKESLRMRQVCVRAIKDVNSKKPSDIFICDVSKTLLNVITEAIGRRRNRIFRENCVVVLPDDSPVVACGGAWKDLDVQKYYEWPSLQQFLSNIENLGSYPKSLFIVLSTVFSEQNLNQLKAFCERIISKSQVTVYISADLMPMKYSDIKSELIRSHQEFLTSWKLKSESKNLVIVSPISATIFTNFPFVTLFSLAQKERKELFEAAVLYLVDGKRFSFESTISRGYIASKRSAPSIWDSSNARNYENVEETILLTDVGI